LLVESRASPPGWTGETPVPPPSYLSRLIEYDIVL